MLIYFYKCGRHLLYCGSQPSACSLTI
jgi:hypothetical protein